MSKKSIGITLIVIGAVIAVLSSVADVIGIGDQLGVGWQQLLLVVIGIFVALFGFWLVLSTPNKQ